MSKIAIIGGDKESLELVSFLNAKKNIDLVYVNHNQAPDLQKPEILVLSDFKELTKTSNLELVIDASHDPRVGKFLRENLSRQVEVLSGCGNYIIHHFLAEIQKTHKETEQTLSRHQEIYKLGIKLNSAMNIQDMADTIIECATRLTNTPAGSLVVYDTRSNTMRLAGIRGFSEKFSQVRKWSVRQGGLTDFIMHQQEPVVIADIAQAPSFDNPLMLKEGVRSVMAVTLVSEGNRIEGILYVDDFVPRSFTEEEITELALLANQAAFGLKKVYLLNELSQTKDYLEAMLNNSPDMIITTDHNTDIVEFNPGAEAMLGYTKEEVIGTSVERFYPDSHERREVMEKVQRFGSVANYETRLITKHGELLDLSLTLSQLKDKAGKVIGTVGISKDITRQKKLEKNLKSSNEKLAQKIEEVKKIDKMKSDFLSIVSHELRTPLTSIIGFSQMIRRRFEKDIVPGLPDIEQPAGQAAKKIKENLNIVISEGNRLSRLINNLLDLAKIEAGKIEWNITRCSLEDICKSAMNSVQSLANEKQLALKIDAEANLPKVNADYDRLIQVVTNLLSNAIKFTYQGSITCSLRQLGDWIEVRVIDTGIGLTADALSQVFERFKQVGDTLTDRPKGTGLGLPISKEIVEAHGGKIWVMSEYGNGCQFVFKLPIVKAAKATTMGKPLLLQEVKDKLYSKIQHIEKGQTILVVDDEDNIRELLHQELEEAGYRVIEAIDGSEALDKARQEQPDLIILDILMPGIDGFDVMSILRNDKETALIPIVIYSIIEDREKGYRLGADDYLTKSGAADALLQSVSSLVAVPRDKQHKVLIIEDDESVVKAVRDALKIRGYEVITAHNGQQGIAKAQAEAPNLIIIDDDISKLNNNEILKTLKNEKNTENASIIILSDGYVNKEKNS